MTAARCTAQLKVPRRPAPLCGAEAWCDVPGHGPRCRVHAPRGEPCPYCARLTCREPGQTFACVFKAYRRRFELAGFAECRTRFAKALAKVSDRLPVYVPVAAWQFGRRELDWRPYVPKKLLTVFHPRVPELRAEARRLIEQAKIPDTSDLDEARERLQALAALSGDKR